MFGVSIAPFESGRRAVGLCSHCLVVAAVLAAVCRWGLLCPRCPGGGRSGSGGVRGASRSRGYTYHLGPPSVALSVLLQGSIHRLHLTPHSSPAPATQGTLGLAKLIPPSYHYHTLPIEV